MQNISSYVKFVNGICVVSNTDNVFNLSTYLFYHWKIQIWFLLFYDEDN